MALQNTDEVSWAINKFRKYLIRNARLKKFSSVSGASKSRELGGIDSLTFYQLS